jgi:hypothetical protein
VLACLHTPALRLDVLQVIAVGDFNVSLSKRDVHSSIDLDHTFSPVS